MNDDLHKFFVNAQDFQREVDAITGQVSKKDVQQEFENVDLHELATQLYKRSFLKKSAELQIEAIEALLKMLHKLQSSTLSFALAMTPADQVDEPTADAILWHVEKDAMRTQYHIAIKEPGQDNIDFILNYWPHEKKIVAEPFLHWEYSYTVHDFCNHENDDCVMDDPDSEESQAAGLEDKYRMIVGSTSESEEK